MTWAKWYTRIIGVFFILIIISLINDYLKFGFTAETMHKIFHIGVGIIVVYYGWNNPRWWRPFALINGSFFTFVAIFGFLFTDFAGLDAFNTLDTTLHSIVGLSGLIIGFTAKEPRILENTTTDHYAIEVIYLGFSISIIQIQDVAIAHNQSITGTGHLSRFANQIPMRWSK